MHYIPKGYSALTPYLICDPAVEAIDFYKEIFGATEIERHPGPNGRVGHCELKIDDSVIMLADPSPEMGAKSPKAIGGSPVCLVLYVKNVDQVIEHAVKRGSELRHAIEDKFYGDRSGTIIDPYGHHWTLSTHVKDVSPEEMAAIACAMANEREKQAAKS